MRDIKKCEKLHFFLFFGHFVPEPVSPEPFDIEAVFFRLHVCFAMLCAFYSVLYPLGGPWET